MPRYYFHLHNGIGSVPDEEGQDLPDLSAATERAMGDIRSIMASDITTGHLDLRGWIDIAEEEGQSLARVRYSEAIVIIPDE